jgi:hypothetical protein
MNEILCLILNPRPSFCSTKWQSFILCRIAPIESLLAPCHWRSLILG